MLHVRSLVWSRGVRMHGLHLRQRVRINWFSIHVYTVVVDMDIASITQPCYVHYQSNNATSCAHHKTN